LHCGNLSPTRKRDIIGADTSVDFDPIPEVKNVKNMVAGEEFDAPHPQR